MGKQLIAEDSPKPLRTLNNGVRIFVTQSGDFYALAKESDEELGRENSMDKLVEKLRKLAKNEHLKMISVKFTDGVTGMDGEITGKHAHTDNWLVREWDAREQKYVTNQTRRYSLSANYGSGSNRLVVLDGAAREELLHLLRQEKEIQSKLRAFRVRHAFKDFAEAVEQAWKDAGGE